MHTIIYILSAIGLWVVIPFVLGLLWLLLMLAIGAFNAWREGITPSDIEHARRMQSFAEHNAHFRARMGEAERLADLCAPRDEALRDTERERRE